MKREKTPMSISTQFFWTSIVIGILWICIGITDMFDGSVINVIHYLLISIAVIVMLFVLRANREELDEMAEYNYMKAKARTRDLMHYVYLVAAIVSAVVFGLLQKADIYWAQVISGMFFVLIGIQDLITGIVFHRLEAE